MNAAGALYKALRRKVLVNRERLDQQEIGQLLATMNVLAESTTMFDRADAEALADGWWERPGRYTVPRI